MVVLVTGSRRWQDWAAIYNDLVKLPEGSTVIHGAARGADKIAGIIGKAIGFTVRPYPANWWKHKRAAGPIRNQQMLDEEPLIELVFAYPMPDSVGTYDMIQRAVKKGITIVYGHV